MATPPKQVFLLFTLLLLTTLTSSSSAQPFKCTSSTQKCDAIIDYIPPNATTLNSIKTLFNIKNLRTILGVNNLPLSTPPNQILTAKQAPIKIPIPCSCTKGTGKSNKKPIYTVVSGDTLDSIATQIFSGLVSYKEIQDVNGVKNPSLIKVGQKLWIPLPCSCDEVEGEKVVHYGHLVPVNSTVEGIAEEYNTTQDVLLRENGLVSANDLKAGAVLNVPLKVCTSMVSNNSLDYPLLVPSGTYLFTAANCIKCTCDATNNYTLQCEPSQLNSSLWKSCPSVQCPDSGEFLGNSTSFGCAQTICSYSGYTNETILTKSYLGSNSTCFDSRSDSSSISSSLWQLNFIVIAAHSLLLFYAHFG